MTRNLFALGFGILGTALALGAWHIYVDHQTWHVLLNQLAAQQRAAQSPTK